jgi:hypothetical protein
MPISTPTLVAQTPDPVECIGPICAAANHSSVHFISSDTVVLDVFGAKVSVPMPSSSDSTEMLATTTKRWWEENDEVKKETKKEEEDDDDGRRKNEEILPGERPFKQRHSKTVKKFGGKIANFLIGQNTLYFEKNFGVEK